MMIDVLFVDKQVILAALMPNVTAVTNLATLHRAAPTRFLPQEHNATNTDLIQDVNIPRGTDHTPPIMVLHVGDISAHHNPTTIPITTGVAVSEGTYHVPHLATTAVHSALLLVDVPIAIHAMTHLTSIITPHPALTISPTDLTHATIPQTRTSPAPTTPTALHRKYGTEKPSHPQDIQPPINPTIPRLSQSRIPLQIFPQIQTVTLIL